MVRSVWSFVVVLVSVVSLASRGQAAALDVRTFHSPSRQFTAIVASPPQGGYEEPSSVTLYGPNLSVTPEPTLAPGLQSVTSTPRQNATRDSICRAAGFGDG